MKITDEEQYLDLMQLAGTSNDDSIREFSVIWDEPHVTERTRIKTMDEEQNLDPMQRRGMTNEWNFTTERLESRSFVTDADGNVCFTLFYYDRKKGLWDRFDKDSLEGYALKSLAVMPMGGVDCGTLADYLDWLKEKRCR